MLQCPLCSAAHVLLYPCARITSLQSCRSFGPPDACTPLLGSHVCAVACTRICRTLAGSLCPRSNRAALHRRFPPACLALAPLFLGLTRAHALACATRAYFQAAPTPGLPPLCCARCGRRSPSPGAQPLPPAALTWCHSLARHPSQRRPPLGPSRPPAPAPSRPPDLAHVARLEPPAPARRASAAAARLPRRPRARAWARSPALWPPSASAAPPALLASTPAACCSRRPPGAVHAPGAQAPSRAWPRPASATPAHPHRCGRSRPRICACAAQSRSTCCRMEERKREKGTGVDKDRAGGGEGRGCQKEEKQRRRGKEISQGPMVNTENCKGLSVKQNFPLI
jgi:hypothetical protein